MPSKTAVVIPTSRQAFRRRVILLISAVMVALSIGVSTAPANAAVSYCGDGRCTVYLSKSETRAFASGRIPAPPASLDWRLRSGYYSLAYAHRWIAGQYASRGWCSAFTLNIRPWATQGYYGYACSWT
jgi:hypothetical protein